jgi:hypothetical protein
MQNNIIRAQNGQTVQLNNGQTAQYEEPPIRVETTVYGTPSKTNPDVYDDYTVETKMWMPDGQQYTNEQPLNNYQAPVVQNAVPAPVTNPAGYVSPARAPTTYAQEVAAQPFNG